MIKNKHISPSCRFLSLSGTLSLWGLCFSVFVLSLLSTIFPVTALAQEEIAASPLSFAGMEDKAGMESRAREAAQVGDLQGAAEAWKKVDAASEKADPGEWAWARANLGDIYQMQGRYDLAEFSLKPVLEKFGFFAGNPTSFVTAVQNESPRLQRALVFVLVTCGNIAIQDGKSAEANDYLQPALKLAGKDPGLGAQVSNNLANLYVLRNEMRSAAAEYEKIYSAFPQSDTVASRAGVNLVLCLTRMGLRKEDYNGNDARPQAEVLWEQMFAAVKKLPPSHDTAQFLLSMSASARALSDYSAKDISSISLSEFSTRKQLWREKAGNAALLGWNMSKSFPADRRTQSLAAGYLGELAESRQPVDAADQERRLAEALEWARQARFLSQNLPYLRYRWERLTGQVLRERGEIDQAIQAYQRAVSALSEISDCDGPPIGQIRGTFRLQVAPVYYELADLQLEQAQTKKEAERKNLLLQARQTVEKLKTAEVVDFYRDDCVLNALSKTKTLDQTVSGANKNTAIIYYIALPDRIAILVDKADGLREYEGHLQVGPENEDRASLPQDELLRTEAQEFRSNLYHSNSADTSYLDYSRRFYDALIRPIEAALDPEQIKTLVFVPDASLRVFPMAALNDGKKFLIEKYAITVTPGLQLMDPKPLRRVTATAFAGGISESQPGIPGLSVVEEVQPLIDHFKAKPPLLNAKFTVKALQHEISTGNDSIIHLVTHGSFENGAQYSYLLTRKDPTDPNDDGKFSMEELASAIEPRQYRGRPVELLTLAACDTGSSDEPGEATERAAMGLAGLALKSGARSALASLWPISDEATTELMKVFYDNLAQHPEMSKAVALQKAQIALIGGTEGQAVTGEDADDSINPPSTWAPYMLIGDWS